MLIWSIIFNGFLTADLIIGKLFIFKMASSVRPYYLEELEGILI